MKLAKPWKLIAFAIGNYWSVVVMALLGVLIIGVLGGYKLGTLVPGFSTDEISARAQSASAHVVRIEPLNLPHKGLQFGLQHFDHHGPVAMRSVSALFGLLIVISFYYVISRWYTPRLAMLCTALLVTSSWFLHITRLATTDIMYSALFILFACGVWLQQSKTSRYALLASTITFLGLLYVPGMIWFILPVVFWQQRRIRQAFRQLGIWQSFLLVILGLAVLAPLVLAIVEQPLLYKAWLGLPEQWPHLTQVIKNILHIPGQLFWRGPDDASRWLDHLSLIDWFGIIMFIMGAYAYWFKLHLDRTWFLIYIGLVGTVLLAVGGPMRLNLFLPFIYLVIAGGIALMLQQWFTVFPHNPFARSLGVSLLVIAVLASCFYQFNHYFIAWPHTQATKSAFQQRP